MTDINELRHTRRDQMDSLISRLQRPGYDLQKEQAFQGAIVVLQQLNAERNERELALMAKLEAAEKEIAAMKQQEPVKYEYQGRDGVWRQFLGQQHYENTVSDGAWSIRALYALPGAKGEEK